MISKSHVPNSLYRGFRNHNNHPILNFSLKSKRIVEASKAKMRTELESRAQRRLETLGHHLSFPHEAKAPLQNILLGGSGWQMVKAELEVTAQPIIIGGMVLDIHAKPSIPANPRTTTPGKVHYVVGGVARNIAECMSKLRIKPYMISAIGEDMAGNLLLEYWKHAGLSTEGILKGKDLQTAIVCNVFDSNGEVAAGVASVEVIEKFLTAEWILQFKDIIHRAPVLMIDANLSLPALEASCRLAAESERLVWFEPVSVVKSKRIASVVNYVTIASPNEDELIAMANALSGSDVFHRDLIYTKSSIASVFHVLKAAIMVLLDKGIKIVIVTLGADGAFVCSKGRPRFMAAPFRKTKQCDLRNELYEAVVQSCPSSWHTDSSKMDETSHLFAVHLPSRPASVLRVTGAGDCLVGGTLASLCAGLDIMRSVAVGIAAAKAAVESETNVPPAFNLARLADDAGQVYSAAKVVS